MNIDPRIGELRVWHIPQIPGKAFHVAVENPKDALLVLDALAMYDIFQFKNNIKPDYCNASGLEVYDTDDGEGKPGWCEWYSEDGDDIDAWGKL